jgi:hypothetical protein
VERWLTLLPVCPVAGYHFTNGCCDAFVGRSRSRSIHSLERSLHSRTPCSPGLNGSYRSSDLDSSCADRTLLGTHPECQLPGVDLSAGSLSQGVSIAGGDALLPVHCSGPRLSSHHRLFRRVAAAEYRPIRLMTLVYGDDIVEALIRLASEINLSTGAILQLRQRRPNYVRRR